MRPTPFRFFQAKPPRQETRVCVKATVPESVAAHVGAQERAKPKRERDVRPTRNATS